MTLFERNPTHGIRTETETPDGIEPGGHRVLPAENSDAVREIVPEGEAADIDDTVKLTTKLQDLRRENDPSQEDRLLRGVHPKSHGCLRASFAIRNDIPEQYRTGLFAQPGKVYDAWIRFSNASVLREDDLKANRENVRQNGSRGMAVKILNVDGDVLESESNRNDQDFLMINTPEFAFANVRDYLRLNKVMELSTKGDNVGPYFVPALLAKLGKPTEGEPVQISQQRNALQQALQMFPFLQQLSAEDLRGTIASAGIVKKISAIFVADPTQIQYFGAAPFLFGPGRAMKFSAAPTNAVDNGELDDDKRATLSENYLSEALRETASGENDLYFDFKVNIQNADAENLQIEDATTTWPDELDGYVDVARITIKLPQWPDTSEAQEHCEKLAFSPWHSLAAHRPLGGINRLRRKVYSESTKHRGADGP